MKLSPLRGVVIGIALLSLVFITISLSTHHWFVTKDSDTANQGLWEVCRKVSSFGVKSVFCNTLPDISVTGKSCSSSL